MNAKELAIKQAYGEHWDVFGKDVDLNTGICWNWNQFISTDSIVFQRDECDTFGSGWRPKSLSGIETNNDWIKIESVDDLPKQTTPCHVEYKGHIYIAVFNGGGNMFTCTGGQVIRNVDAYRPIIMPIKRIY